MKGRVHMHNQALTHTELSMCAYIQTRTLLSPALSSWPLVRHYKHTYANASKRKRAYAHIDTQQRSKSASTQTPVYMRVDVHAHDTRLKGGLGLTIGAGSLSFEHRSRCCLQLSSQPVHAALQFADFAVQRVCLRGEGLPVHVIVIVHVCTCA
jgi:hypothetical protein